VLLIGRGYSGEEKEEARIVLTDYMEEIGVPDGIVVKISQKVFDEVGCEGVLGSVKEQLEAHCRN
jgi:hypothetical protein